jgi:hypothetical protein
MRVFSTALVLVALLAAAGCPVTTSQRNAFVTLAEEFGVPSTGTTDRGGGATGAGTSDMFRRTMSVSFANTHPTADVETSFVAWVEISSIRSADQQDALLRDGYVQLTREVSLGTPYTLPPGTFVYNGPGTAGATRVRLGPTQAASQLPTTDVIELITPDVILVFVQPPVSCENVAFQFMREGEVIFEDDNNPSRRTFDEGGFKTLAQVDVYQCDPLRPGLFLKRGGGLRQPNEYFEGESVAYQFNQLPDGDGDFATVAIGP